MIKKFLFSLIFFIFLTNCGFKVVNKNLYNFSIKEITTKGDDKINFILRNKLKTQNGENKYNIKLDLLSKKTKDIKEKNIKNEITKYQITISVNVNYTVIEFSKAGNFVIEKNRSFNVEDQYSQTVTNENNLIDAMSKEISDEINNNLIIITNDL